MKQTRTSKRTPHDQTVKNDARPADTLVPDPEKQSEFRCGSLAAASAQEKVDVCTVLSAMFYGVNSNAFEAHTRHDRRINEARQLSVYLANTSLGIDYEEIAKIVNRDRTTVRYSIERVEDRRENPGFDSVLIALETLIGCFQDRDVAEMIENGLCIDHGLVAYVPRDD